MRSITSLPWVENGDCVDGPAGAGEVRLDLLRLPFIGLSVRLMFRLRLGSDPEPGIPHMSVLLVGVAVCWGSRR